MPLRPQPKQIESISVKGLVDAADGTLHLTLACGEKGLTRVIRDKSINRPALTLTGFFKNFGAKRIQLFGAGEMAYMRELPASRQLEIMQRMVEKHIPCIIVSRNLLPTPAMEKVCEESNTPLFRTPMSTKDLSAQVMLLLEEIFAPKQGEHGTLMDVKGIGTLIRGKSGVGKSECALALIERGHSLVADDMVYITLHSEKYLVGRSSDLNRGYMECRGLGIVNISELFGIRSVRLEKEINLVITFEEWKHGMDEERTGLEQEYFDILGIKIPHIILPVRPGRDMARLVEVAAMVEALKQIGHDSAKEFNDRLIAFMAGEKG
ncbi:MAG: HPr(Ser) kinase/phosphatase [Opitutales bacterium]|jgi:HPr kinase/phosphorylase